MVFRPGRSRDRPFRLPVPEYPVMHSVCRVVPPVPQRHPHGPGRAQFRHPVLLPTDSLRRRT